MYCIKDGYIERKQLEYFDDTWLTDEWQNEVYEAARQLADAINARKIIDIGTGSGFKLLKYFKDFETLGIDLEPTVKWLSKKYPDRNWDYIYKPQAADLIICSDVIEHVYDPEPILKFIKSCKPRLVVVSTPDRDLLKDYEQNGPPGNLSHVREWNFFEFDNFMAMHFNIIDHYISNKDQATQVVVARLKETND